MAITEADRVEVQVLVDNVTDALSSTPAFVTREFAALQKKGMRRIAGASLCCANHGLSLVVTAHGPNGPRTILFDGGPVDYAVERNGTRLGIDFGAIEAAMLSHGHWDHAGGIPHALGMIQAANGGQSIPLYLHPGMFHERGGLRPFPELGRVPINEVYVRFAPVSDHARAAAQYVAKGQKMVYRGGCFSTADERAAPSRYDV